VDGDRIYAIGVSGDLVCLQRADGKLLWHKSLVTDFGGKVPNWGYTESPLVDGDRVIATPGGSGATVVALNKITGNLILNWQVPEGDAAAYTSVIAEEIDGKREYIAFLTGGVVGLSATDGKFLWRTHRPANGIVIATPVYRDHLLFASTAYNKGGGLVRLTTGPGGEMKADDVYFDQTYQNHHGGVLLIGDYVYYSEGHQIARLTCREFKTGKLMWADENKTKCSLVYADGNIYARSEKGTMMLLEANPNKLVVKGSFEQPDRSGKNAWSHPVVAGGRLYLRDQDILLCYDVHDPALK
jgi:outer membrane protein assembly factor BamB